MPDSLSQTDPRRKLLRTLASPAQRLDYMVTVRGQLNFAAFTPPVALAIRYVPDGLIVDQAAIPAYLRALEKAEWGSLEEMAAAVLEDLNNELVARWIEVGVANSPATAGAAVFDYAIVMDDHQPNWSNPALLGRLQGLLQA